MIETELLINIVREQRLLWDKRHKNYRNRLLTKRAWRNVAETLGCTSDEAQSKWKNLRDSFSRELKKIPNRRAGGDVNELALYTGDWLYFDSMKFLKDVIRHRKTATNVRSRILEEPDNVDEESLGSVMSNSTGISSNPDNQTYLPSEFDSFPAMPYESNQVTSVPTDDLLPPDILQKDYSAAGISGTVENKNIKQNDFAEIFAELERQKMDLLKRELEIQEDEDMNWFKSVLPHLRTLPPLNKFIFRTKVQEMLLNELTKLNSLQAGPSTAQTMSNLSPSDTLQ